MDTESAIRAMRRTGTLPQCCAMCRQGRDACPTPLACHVAQSEDDTDADIDREIRGVLFLALIALLAVAAMAFMAVLLPH